MNLACSLFLIRIMKSEIPNITGSIHNQTNIFYDSLGSGAFFVTGTNSGLWIQGSGSFVAPDVYFDASLSCDRYANEYTEVNPLYESCVFIISY